MPKKTSTIRRAANLVIQSIEGVGHSYKLGGKATLSNTELVGYLNRAGGMPRISGKQNE